MLKKIIFIIISLIILIILFSLYYKNVLNKTQETEEIQIDYGKNSVFIGFTPSEIANKLAEVFEIAPLKSKELESHAGKYWYKYYYKNNASIIITVDISDKSLWSGITSPIIMHGGKNSYDEITNDPSKTAEFILNAWNKFLDGFNCQLNEEDCNITYKPWSESGLNVKIQQVSNSEIPLMNTGMDAHISQEDSQINTIEIDEWSRIKIDKNFSISLDECKNIIENETPDISINKSKLNFTGFIYFSENVYYFHKYKIPIEEVSNTSGTFQSAGSYTITENGTKIENEYEEWIGYNFYVNVETGELTFRKYGIRYL